MRLLISSAFGACTLAASILHSRRFEHSRIMRLNVMRRFMAEKRIRRVAALPQPHRENSQQAEGREQGGPMLVDGLDTIQPFPNHQGIPQRVSPTIGNYYSSSPQQNLKILQQKDLPKLPNSSGQIRQLIFETLVRETGPLSGWQATVEIQERINLILDL
jgi:hypothetical protein